MLLWETKKIVSSVSKVLSPLSSSRRHGRYCCLHSSLPAKIDVTVMKNGALSCHPVVVYVALVDIIGDIVEFDFISISVGATNHHIVIEGQMNQDVRTYLRWR